MSKEAMVFAKEYIKNFRESHDEVDIDEGWTVYCVCLELEKAISEAYDKVFENGIVNASNR